MDLDLEKPGTTARVRETVEAGARGAGDYRCLECGYGIVTFGFVPTCPMCHGAAWEQARWSPFSARARAARRGSAED